MSPPITPGEILLEEYIKPMGISQNAMARAIGAVFPGTPSTSSALQSPARAITAAMSIRCGVVFSQSPEFWHGIQVECDFRALAKQEKRLANKILPANELASGA